MFWCHRQLPSQALSVRSDRLTQDRRVLSQLPHQSGPQPANALTRLDNLPAAELAVPQQLEADRNASTRMC